MKELLLIIKHKLQSSKRSKNIYAAYEFWLKFYVSSLGASVALCVFSLIAFVSCLMGIVSITVAKTANLKLLKQKEYIEKLYTETEDLNNHTIITEIVKYNNKVTEIKASKEAMGIFSIYYYYDDFDKIILKK